MSTDRPFNPKSGAPAGPTAPPPATPEGELDLATRERIEAMSASLATADHYTLLGVERNADAAAIKRAYLKRVSEFHPDRFVKKNLGAYKAKLVTIFARITQANEALSSAEQRAAYDALLASGKLPKASAPPPTMTPDQAARDVLVRRLLGPRGFR
jgi:curved DNA-binding protein CbpA